MRRGLLSLLLFELWQLSFPSRSAHFIFHCSTMPRELDRSRYRTAHAVDRERGISIKNIIAQNRLKTGKVETVGGVDKTRSYARSRSVQGLPLSGCAAAMRGYESKRTSVFHLKFVSSVFIICAGMHS